MATAGVGADVARGATQDEQGSDNDVLQTLVRMEQLQVAVYDELDQAIEDGDIDGFGTTDDLGRLIDVTSDIQSHEQRHLDRLETALEDAGGESPAEESFGFSADTVTGLVGIAENIEEEAVGLYAGAVTQLGDQDIASTVGSIYGVEGRHVAALKMADQLDPFDGAFQSTVSLDDAESYIDEFVVG